MSAPTTSRRIKGLPRRGIWGLTDLAVRSPRAIRLEIGDPHLATPCGAISLASFAFDAGDEGLVLDPCRPSYRPLALAAAEEDVAEGVERLAAAVVAAW